MNGLSGKRIAFLTAQIGVEQSELTSPWEAVVAAGGTPVLVAPETGTVQAMEHDTEKAGTFSVGIALKEAEADSFDALVLPGGTVNADKVRGDGESVKFVGSFVDANKPVAAICHGPWVLAEADVLKGKTLTSFSSLRTDLKNAGANWIDQEVKHCPANGWDLVSSRNPGDLEVFNKALVDVFGNPRQ